MINKLSYTRIRDFNLDNRVQDIGLARDLKNLSFILHSFSNLLASHLYFSASGGFIKSRLIRTCTLFRSEATDSGIMYQCSPLQADS
jgi:hypothetical protein